MAALNEIHQPDNLETTVNGNLLVTEDPSSANQYDAGDPNSTRGEALDGAAQRP